MCLTEGVGYCLGGKYIPNLLGYVGTMSCGLMWGVLWTLGWHIPGQVLVQFLDMHSDFWSVRKK